MQKKLIYNCVKQIKFEKEIFLINHKILNLLKKIISIEFRKHFHIYLHIQ